MGVPAAPAGGGDASQGRIVIKGRGANSNRASRYLPTHSEAESDGWETAEAPGGPAAGVDSGVEVATELYPDATRRLITRNQSPDIPFDRSINPYKGCEHGCIYCFARPTHAYLDLSPGIDFETRIFYKTGVRETLIAELGKPGYRCRPIAMGTNTDPYQPAEKTQRVTRTVLEVLLEHNHPVTIVTKGQLILRDLDLLSELARRGLASVAVSLTTLDNELKTRLEPRAAGPAARLRMIRELSDAGVPTGVMVAPVIPFLNDHEIEAMVQAAAEAGASRANYILLRLPLEVAPLFEDWLAVHYPMRAERVMSAIRASRGGKAYDSTWGRRMRGEGVFADLIGRRFAAAVKRFGLEQEGRGQEELRTDLFRPPGHRQMDLF
ncbi:MAG TPA: PA0069 family radical SAM protein [Pseudomonadales bacterium]